MTIKTQVNELLQKKMDRQDFLKHVAIGVVTLTGATAVLHVLAPQQQKTAVKGSYGYGSSAYGGNSEPARAQ